MRTSFLAAGAATALALTLAPAAHAGPISFERDGDVWLVASDGSGLRQVTSGGGYSSPSLADDGTLVAAHGSRLRRLAPDGTILSDVATVVTGTELLGPLDPDVSPDGTKVVYEWGDGRAVGGSTVTLSDRAGGREDLGRLEDSEPSWVDDDTLVLRTPTLGFAVWAPVPTPVDGSRYWFDAGVGLLDPTATRDGGYVAYVTRFSRTFITVWRTQGGIPGGGRPLPCFQLERPDGQFDDPSFSPDGSALVWQESSGIWTIALDNGCAPPRSLARLLVAGGRSPDWGGPVVKPPPPDDRRVDERPPPPPPPPRPPVDDTPRPLPVARAPTLALAGRAPKLRALAKSRALKLTLRCDGACGATLRATVGRATARKLKLRSTTLASARASGSGTVTVKLTLAKKVAAALGRQRAVTVTVAGSGSYGGKSAPLKVTLTLKR